MKEMLIVGGGIAGLSAAAELSRNGCAVTLLEAKERLGGRIHTQAGSGFAIELGAEFLHGQTRALHETIRAAGLSTHPVAPSSELVGQGGLHPLLLWEKISGIIHRVDPLEPDCSFQEFLDRHPFPERDRRLAVAFVNGYEAARAERISSQALLRGQLAAEKMEIPSQARLNEGYAGLIRFLERETRARGGKILTGAEVEKIRWRPGRVRLEARLAAGTASRIRPISHLAKCEITPPAPPAGRLQTFEADAVLITLPLGVLKSQTVQFDPPLIRKREAIAGLEFGHVTKITLVFQERWWRPFGFILALNQPLPTWWTDPRGPVLTGWAGGPQAEALLNHSPEELQELALNTLAGIFSERLPVLHDRLRSSHTCNWGRDPHIRGAYSYVPVNGCDLPRILAAPVSDTLYFAGEATVSDADTGTVSGAFESGRRAAREALSLRPSRPRR